MADALIAAVPQIGVTIGAGTSCGLDMGPATAAACASVTARMTAAWPRGAWSWCGRPLPGRRHENGASSGESSSFYLGDPGNYLSEEISSGALWWFCCVIWKRLAKRIHDHLMMVTASPDAYPRFMRPHALLL